MGVSIVGLTPMGHMCAAREVSYGCLFLAGDESTFMIGR
jgi:hypothetical protein